MSRRFQFSLKWLFVAIAVVAAFFAGAIAQGECEFQRQLDFDNAVAKKGTYIERARPPLLTSSYQEHTPRP